MNSFKLKYLFLIAFIFGCKQDSLKSSLLDNLNQGDTLTLYAQFADCGEFGGHIEKVEITKKENTFWKAFYKDTVSCETDPNQNRKKTIGLSEQLTSRDRININTYIAKFKKAITREQNSISVSANLFQIVTKDSTIQYIDWAKTWNEFKIIQNQTFE